MPVSSRVAANEFIRLAAERGSSLTPLQIMKLVYISHGWSLGIDGTPLLDEPIEAWRYGPVLPRLYGQMRTYGANPVDGPLRTGFFAGPERPLADRERELVQQTYESYGRMNGIELSALTHAPDTPWSITWNREGQNAPIPRDMIAEHYRQLARDRNGA